MRKIALIPFLLLASIVYSQDFIITHKGESIKCNVTELTETAIKYKYEGEQVVNSISKNAVGEIKFASGRVQKITDKVNVNSEADWERVQITQSEDDVEGLVRKKELLAKANAGTAFSKSTKVEQRAIDKLKKEAAANGCHIILLSKSSDRTNWSGQHVSTKVSGIAYSY
ncbi:MAG: hypothetical protein ORN54_15065 [Cyclobacteriaceae bacterium]|nr:hypothetical protein [Cyclobacteriaceae bacterium]